MEVVISVDRMLGTIIERRKDTGLGIRGQRREKPQQRRRGERERRKVPSNKERMSGAGGLQSKDNNTVIYLNKFSVAEQIKISGQMPNGGEGGREREREAAASIQKVVRGHKRKQRGRSRQLIRGGENVKKAKERDRVGSRERGNIWGVDNIKWPVRRRNFISASFSYQQKHPRNKGKQKRQYWNRD